MPKQLWMLSLFPIAALAGCNQPAEAPTTANTAAEDMSTMNMPAEENMEANAMADTMASPAQQFADAAGASDWFEVEAGKLAQDHAKSQGLKDFGKMMVTAHTDSTNKLKAAGAKLSPAIAPNPQLNAEQEANLAALKQVDDAGFDALYKSQQMAAHEKALAAMKDYAANGAVPELKTFASDTVKVVEAHIAKLKTL